MAKRISKHISYAEGIKSATAERLNIENEPSRLVLLRMRNIAKDVFEPLREKYCTPIAVTSFYRSPELNRRIGGSTTSQHCKGEAMDLDADVYGTISNADIFYYIKNNLDFDQLIWEFGNNYNPSWVHVSYKKEGRNRKQILKAVKKPNWAGKLKTHYIPF